MTVIYVKTVVFTSNFLVERRIVSSKISRKIVHIAAGSWIIMWPLFVVVGVGADAHGVPKDGDDGDASTEDGDDGDDWSWRLNITVPVIYSITLLYKGLFLSRSTSTSASAAATSSITTTTTTTKPPIVDPDVQSMTRTGDPRELLNGPLVFTIVMCVVGGVRRLFRTHGACIVMSCLGWGDGVAPLVGYYYPYGQYLTWPFHAPTSSSSSSDNNKDTSTDSNNYKTVSGSIAFWLSSIIGYYILASVALLTPFEDVSATSSTTTAAAAAEFIPFSMVVQIATTSTIAESLTGPYDNIAVAITAGLTYYYLVV